MLNFAAFLINLYKENERPLFAFLIAYCLMPNHFHLLFYVKNLSISRKLFLEHRDKVEFERRQTVYGEKARPVDAFYNRSNLSFDTVLFNEAIGHLLKSYTKAINKQMDRTGSLFRQKTKAKDGWIDEFIAEKRLNGKRNHKFLAGNDFGYTCLCYIHENPVKAGLVEKAEDWTYSSAQDYAGLRKGTLCNMEEGHRLINFV